LARAASGPINLAVAAAGALGAAALNSWPVLALGGAAYAALVAWDLATPDFWKKLQARDVLPPTALPEPSTVEDPEARSALVELWVAHRELERVLEDTSPQVTGYVSTMLGSLRQLETHAKALVERSDVLSRYLGNVSVSTVQTALDRTRGAAATAQDPEARSQLLGAQKSREEQLAALGDIQEARQRILANLSKLVATLQALPPKVLRMQVLDTAAIDAMSGDVNRELDTLSAEVSAFEETLRMPSLETVHGG